MRQCALRGAEDAEAIRTPDKLERLENMDEVEVETRNTLREIYPEGAKDIDSFFTISPGNRQAVILDEGIRPDNRKLDEIRTDLLREGASCRERMARPRSERRDRHRSCRLYAERLPARRRRSTASPSRPPSAICTLTTSPGYSVGEAKTSRSPGRREIGHGALAEKRALIPVPPVEEFRMRSAWYRKFYPPTVRLPWAPPAAPAWR